MAGPPARPPSLTDGTVWALGTRLLTSRRAETFQPGSSSIVWVKFCVRTCDFLSLLLRSPGSGRGKH